MALEQQNESTKDAKFKAKNWELKTTGVNCLASCHTGSLSCSGSPDLMCKIDISVLSIFLCQFVLPCGAKSAFFLQAAKYIASTALGTEPDLFDGNVKTITMPHSTAAARDEEDLRISFMLSVPYSILNSSLRPLSIQFALAHPTHL